MSYRQEAVLRLTVKGDIDGLKTPLTEEKLQEMLETEEGRTKLVERLTIMEIEEASIIRLSKEAIFVG